MAFTKTPTQSSAQTKVIPLEFPRDPRSAGGTDLRDTIARNVVFETIKDNFSEQPLHRAIKREGTRRCTWRLIGPNPTNTAFDSEVMSIFRSPTSNHQYVLTANGTVYRGTWQEYNLGPGDVDFEVLQTFATISAFRQLDWADFQYDSGDYATLLAKATNLDLFSSAGAHSIISYPGNNYDVVVLDGYVFTSNRNGNIWNSALNDPTNWPASNFIAAEAYGDALIRIARSGSYIVAFGTDSIQWFYNAANPTGSPLAVYPGATQRIGYLGGLTSLGDTLFFIGRASNGAVRLYKAAGLKIEPVLDFPWSRQEDLAPDGFGNMWTVQGHTLYCFTTFLQTGGSADQVSRQTYCFDVDQQVFTTIEWQAGTAFAMLQTTPVNFCRMSSLFLYRQDVSLYQDDGVPFYAMVRTNIFDGDTRRNKFVSRMLLHCDQVIPDVPGTPVNAQVTMARADGTYTSFGSAVDVTQPYPVAWQQGIGRTLQFQIFFLQNYPWRIEGVEVDYDLGIQ